jgi:RNA polymerase sigma-70 factor (ECF subfamily)
MALLIDNGSRTLEQPVRDHLGEQLRDFYHDLIEDSLPTDLANLVRRLECAIQARNEAPDRAFMAELMEAVPHLRAFAISRTHNVDRAEDLVQEAILKAWDKRASYEPGTNLIGWLFTILRNQHISEHRKSVREVEDVDGIYAAGLVALPDQIGRLEIRDISVALDKLCPEYREALILVGVQGMSYEDAAVVMGTAVGTAKSRVNRARKHMAEFLSLDSEGAGGIRFLHE